MNLYKSKNVICKSIVCIAPALNVKEEKYLDLINELQEENNDVIFIPLNNFDINIENTFEKIRYDFFCAYNKANKINENNPKVPIYFIGFSFGALVGIYFLYKYFNEIKFDRMILVAPAIAFRMIPNLSRNICSLPFNFSVTTFTPKNYRIYNKLLLSIYKVISHLNNEIKRNKFYKLNITAKIFISPKDELISKKKVGNLISKYKLTNWDITEIKKKKKKGLKDFYHLIADKNSLGENEWSYFTNEIIEFLK